MRVKFILFAFFFSISISAGVNEDLLKSVLAENVESVLSELTKGADANFRNNKGKPLLSIAVEKKNIQIIRLLIEKGGKVNSVEKSKDTPGWTPLMHATETGQIEIVKLLLDNGANKKQSNGKGYDALYLAELWGYNEIASLLKGETISGKKHYPIEKILL